MFPFGKSAQQKRIDDLVYENRCLSEALEEAQRKNRELDGLAKQYRDRSDTAGRQKAHLEAENHRLAAELARLTTRGPGGRFVKVDALRPNGTAAAVQVVARG